MGAPIKINKDLLVITPNYTKKWLAEGQSKVSGLHSQVAFPFAPYALRAWACQKKKKKKACISEQKIKRRDCPSAPGPPGPNIPELQTKGSPAQGCLILPLSLQDPAEETPTHFFFPIKFTYTDCAQRAVLFDLTNLQSVMLTIMNGFMVSASRSLCWAAVQFQWQVHPPVESFTHDGICSFHEKAD